MKKKMIWIGIILIIVAGIAGYKIKMGSQAMAVEAVKVTRGDIAEYIEEKGTVLLEEETEVFSTTAGKVIEAPRKVGESVKAGDLLVRFDNKDLLLQIAAMEAQRLSVVAKYDEAKSAKDEEEVRKLNAKLRSAEASYAEAKRVMDNNRALYEAGAISLDTYKSSITKLASAEADLENTKSDLVLAEKGLSVNISKQYEAQLSELKARIKQLEIMNEEMVVKAPMDGMILASEVQKGNVIRSGDKLYEIGVSEGLYIESNILIEDIKEVKEGSTVLIEDQDLGITDLTGSVRKIYPKAESIMSDLGIEQKRVRIEIDMADNKSADLKPGYDMTVKVVTRSRTATLLIPEKAVFDYQGKKHVFVNEDGIARLRVIEKGLESDEQIEILAGLKEGELVVLSPDEALEEGTKIK